MQYASFRLRVTRDRSGSARRWDFRRVLCGGWRAFLAQSDWLLGARLDDGSLLESGFCVLASAGAFRSVCSRAHCMLAASLTRTNSRECARQEHPNNHVPALNMELSAGDCVVLDAGARVTPLDVSGGSGKAKLPSSPFYFSALVYAARDLNPRPLPVPVRL